MTVGEFVALAARVPQLQGWGVCIGRDGELPCAVVRIGSPSSLHNETSAAEVAWYTAAGQRLYVVIR